MEELPCRSVAMAKFAMAARRPKGATAITARIHTARFLALLEQADYVFHW